jgi:hypothetical protein
MTRPNDREATGADAVDHHAHRGHHQHTDKEESQTPAAEENDKDQHVGVRTAARVCSRHAR